jgi:hypothetical protein
MRRAFVSALVVAAALVAPSAARSHEAPTHYFPIQAHSGVVSYLDCFTGHWGFHVCVQTTWSQVGNACGYLHHVWVYYDYRGRDILPGPLGIQFPDGHGQYYDVDYQYGQWWDGWSANAAHVNDWICGGWGNNLGLFTDKINVDPEAGNHYSKTIWYRP